MIRLTAIELENFKNVGRGRVVLTPVQTDPSMWQANIIGIYGQNGSGKTSIIIALNILKSIWATGEPSDMCEDCIAVNGNSFTISVDAVAHSGDSSFPECSLTYTVKVSKHDDTLFVSEEKLTYKNLEATKPSQKTAFHFSTISSSAELTPKVAWEALCTLDKSFATDMAVAQRIAIKEGCSLLMSNNLDSLLSDMKDKHRERTTAGMASVACTKAYNDTFTFAFGLKNELRKFAIENLAVVTPSRQAESMLNVIRISTHEGYEGNDADVYFGIDLHQPALVSKEHMPALQTTVSTISTVIRALVPGLSIGVKPLGGMLDDEGMPAERIEIVATRGDSTVPLRAESEGIKKLISILILLIDVYAKPSACVAIDEFDSGVFEFLLGEILQVLQDHGRGQLIFTAHNLRPLETLDKTSLVFTTTNPNNRYVSFKGTRATNNLRDQYLRAINLGGQPETIYQTTSKYEIDSAFYDAAHPQS